MCSQAGATNGPTGCFKYVYSLSVDMDSALEFDAFDAVYEDSVEQCEYIAEQGRRLEARGATKKVGQLAKAAAIRDGRTECFKCPLPHRCRRIWKTRKSFTNHMLNMPLHAELDALYGKQRGKHVLRIA